jgi:transposase
MWNQYIGLGQIYFPNAKIIIDKYHFIRQITWAIDRIRKQLQQTIVYVPNLILYICKKFIISIDILGKCKI